MVGSEVSFISITTADIKITVCLLQGGAVRGVMGGGDEGGGWRDNA